MKKPVVTKRRLRGHAELAEQRRKEAALGWASRFERALKAALEGQHRELIIEVCRILIRRLSRIVETNGDIGRAQGILAGAATDLSPAYRPEAKGRAEANALFAPKEAA
jgi:hypothetical protein